VNIFVVSPYYGDDRWGEPEAVFTSEAEAEKYRSMGDMEVTELKLEGA
jgi:dsDNA-binding SOS-regulon protein